MSRLNRFLLVTAIGIIVCVVTAYARAEVSAQSKEYSQQENIVSACRAEPEGKWLAEYNECEQMPVQTCNDLDGEMNECASACRHHPEAEMCITVCVPVCKFEL